jgi:PIN domain nuclease of toxin-antitoxin system
MILLDTHIWVWWVDGSPRLSLRQQELIEQHRSEGLGISIISCWEIAKLAEKNKLALSCTVEEWLSTAIAYPGVQLLDLTVPIVVCSTQLDGFHRDPADQLIVATAIVQECSLLIADQKILDYANVRTLQ